MHIFPLVSPYLCSLSFCQYLLPTIIHFLSLTFFHHIIILIKLLKECAIMSDEALYPIIGSESNLPFYVHGAGWCEYQYHAIRHEGYPVAQINYCIDGQGVLIVNGKQHMLQKGMSFFLPANLKHEYYTVGPCWHLHWITFAGKALTPLLNELQMQDTIILIHNPLSKIDSLWNQIFQTIKKDAQYGSYRASAYLYEYLLEYHYESIHSKEKNSLTEQQLSLVIDYINLHYMEDLSITDLSTLINVSPQYLCRQFQATLHMRPFEYITKKRLQVAKNLLLTGRYTVNDIAVLIGYHDCSYFCRLFRKYEHMSPSMLIPKLR